jgi:hypothetical protein
MIGDAPCRSEGERGESGPWIGRGEALRVARRGKGGEWWRRPNPDE